MPERWYVLLVRISHHRFLPRYQCYYITREAIVVVVVIIIDDDPTTRERVVQRIIQPGRRVANRSLVVLPRQRDDDDPTRVVIMPFSRSMSATTEGWRVLGLQATLQIRQDDLVLRAAARRSASSFACATIRSVFASATLCSASTSIGNRSSTRGEALALSPLRRAATRDRRAAASARANFGAHPWRRLERRLVVVSRSPPVGERRPAGKRGPSRERVGAASHLCL